MSISTQGPPRSDAISQSVVEAVAAAEGVEPAELTPPLYEVVDPDALGRVFESTDDTVRHGQVVFTYCGHEVTVTGGGTVTVEEPDSTA